MYWFGKKSLFWGWCGLIMCVFGGIVVDCDDLVCVVNDVVG